MYRVMRQVARVYCVDIIYNIIYKLLLLLYSRYAILRSAVRCDAFGKEKITNHPPHILYNMCVCARVYTTYLHYVKVMRVIHIYTHILVCVSLRLVSCVLS